MSEPSPHTADGGERLPRDRAAERPAHGAAAGEATTGDSATRRSTRNDRDRGDRAAGRGAAGRGTAGRRTPARGTPGRAGRRTAADDARTERAVATGAANDPANDAEVSPADRPAGPARAGGRWPMAERSLMASVLGLPPVAAVGVAAALTAIGVAVDLLRTGTLGTVFLVCYLTGCVLATAWVRRSGVFWPMVAPPLLMAVAVPAVVLLAGSPRPGAGVAQRLLLIGAPLVNGFPAMAGTTGLVLVIGVFRLVTQRIGPRRPGRDAAPAGARTSASPRRS